MFALITGGSAGGKSEFAENLALSVSTNKKRIYLATMIAFGEEGRYRVKRHKKLREGKGFLTVEAPTDFCGLTEDFPDCMEYTVLLEDLSNLVANILFSGEEKSEDEFLDIIISNVELLAANCQNLIVVTNNVFEDGIEYEEDTVLFMKVLARANNILANKCDYFSEIVVGLENRIK